MNLNWHLNRVTWEKYGNCWTWKKVRAFTFYSGNQVQIVWGRIAFVFERKVWKQKEPAR